MACTDSYAVLCVDSLQGVRMQIGGDTGQRYSLAVSLTQRNIVAGKAAEP